MSDKPIRTHNAYHLGDNLVHLNFLRRVAKANPARTFIHCARWQYIWQLRDAVADIPNIAIWEIDSDPNYFCCDFDATKHNDSINAWRGAGGDWYRHQDRNDFVKYHIEHWFPIISKQMGVDNPIRVPIDMLFDYPAINSPLPPGHALPMPFDVLFINSAPGSGQFLGYDEVALGNVALSIARKGYKVITTSKICDLPCTMDTPRLSVSQIGRLSLNCHTIIMVSTGPSWPTFNIWNSQPTERNGASSPYRIIMLDSERVHLAPNTHHCTSLDEVTRLVKEIGLI